MQMKEHLSWGWCLLAKVITGLVVSRCGTIGGWCVWLYTTDPPVVVVKCLGFSK